MTQSYSLTLKIQIRRLRNSSILCLTAGSAASYSLLVHHHEVWALIFAIVTVQATVGSAIIMFDLKRDLDEARNASDV